MVMAVTFVLKHCQESNRLVARGKEIFAETLEGHSCAGVPCTFAQT
jgi:hypothetical protein